MLELGSTRRVTGETDAAAALNTMADEIHEVMAKYGYKTGKLARSDLIGRDRHADHDRADERRPVRRTAAAPLAAARGGLLRPTLLAPASRWP